MEEIEIGRTRNRTILFGAIIFVVVIAALWFVAGKSGPSKIPHAGPAGDNNAKSGSPAPR